jgi:hypothetical protein
MQRIYSLAYLTSAPMAPPDALVLAQKLGYQAIGVRIAPAAPGGDFSPLTEDPAMLRDTVARIQDTGVPVFDVEIARLNENFHADQFKRFLETAGTPGARAILVAGDDPDEGRLTASYAAFCDAAAPFNLTADLEFMPWDRGSRCQECAADHHQCRPAQRPRPCRLASRRPFDHDAGRSRRHPGQPAELRAAMRCARRSPDYPGGPDPHCALRAPASRRRRHRSRRHRQAIAQRSAAQPRDSQ